MSYPKELQEHVTENCELCDGKGYIEVPCAVIDGVLVDDVQRPCLCQKLDFSQVEDEWEIYS